jgi:hypothetical protein
MTWQRDFQIFRLICDPTHFGLRREGKAIRVTEDFNALVRQFEDSKLAHLLITFNICRLK